jgi:hypothetical protein
MSKIEREMIAEARAARDAKHDTSASVSDTELGVDRPSAPNDEQTSDAAIESAWMYAHIMGHVPPLCREDGDGQG